MKKRVLLADGSLPLLHSILQNKAAKEYLFETATSGEECLSKIDTFKPDLLIIDLMLPHMHAIEILHRERVLLEHKKMGAIVLSAEPMIQNYHGAVSHHASYFLQKPFAPTLLFDLIARFFAGTLSPAPFPSLVEEAANNHTGHYLPPLHAPKNYLKFWGTRGSSAVSGTQYVRFGGNTSCLEVRHEEHFVIIDAGTGIRQLGEELALSGNKVIHLFFGHSHFDHIAGFPFFRPLYDPSCHIHIYAPVGYEKTTRELFTDMLAYAYFPVRIDDIQAKLTFHEMRDGGSFSVGPIELFTYYAFHPGPTLCFKIRVGGHIFGYVTDNELLMGYQGSPCSVQRDDPLLAPHLPLLKAFEECHFLIHEAQYTPDEYQDKIGWGHSSISNAAVFFKHSGIPEWIITHHDPRHTDEDLLNKIQLHHDILQQCNVPCYARMAFDGWSLPL